MKQIAKKLMVAAVATVAVAGSVHAQDFCPYVGLDAKQIWRSPALVLMHSLVEKCTKW